MALRLTLVSHAATLAQKQARFPAGEPVLMDWQAQANKYSQFAGRRTRFVHGPELRTSQTATLFSEQSDIDHGLRDCDFGQWQGLSIEEIEQADLGAWMSDWQAAPHGGESIERLYQRVGEWMDGLTGTGHVVAITHPFVIRAALMRVLQCPPVAFHAIDIEPLSTVDLRFNGMWRMRAVSL
jgi:broad specificity phosphatase PhoE